MAPAILPEFFILLGTDLFLLLSLLTCLLDNRFPKALPYVFQAAAVMGFGHLLISKEFFAIFGEYMRFWYSFFYLLIALINIVALNVYFATSLKMWTMAKAWAGTVTFPSIMISVFFVSNYGYVASAEFPFLLLQVGLVISAIVIGISAALFLSPDLLPKLRRRKEVN
ncbi:MAG TPA: hypothetical protein VJ249_12110 [Candidatus Bathyarchaeia archaeon]|nr:hypothetical protein [Candidatus Bathyarchaeia archaeon]